MIATNACGLSARRTRRVVFALVVLMTACSPGDGTTRDDESASATTSGSVPSASFTAGASAGESLEVMPDVIVAEPSAVRPGETVRLELLQESMRGIGWALERREDGRWRHLYDLISDKRGGPPAWQEVGGDIEIDLVAITGSGPDIVVIPESAEPGDYRICTLFVEHGFCASLTILPSA